MDALIISADDYGYAPSYDRGILEAVHAGAIDAVSVMVWNPHPVDPQALLQTRVEVGLHVNLPQAIIAPTAAQLRTHLEQELAEFELLFGQSPAFLDGHHHCHARTGAAASIGRLAAERGLVVRSVSEAHRRMLHKLAVATPDRLVGRLAESEPALPREIEALLVGDEVVPGIVEWMVHPGHPDPTAGSTYDAGRLQDLELLMELREELALRRLRASHAVALGL